MVRILDNYPQTVSITASNIREARSWAQKKGYNTKTVESSRLGEKKRKVFFGTSSKVYIIAKK